MWQLLLLFGIQITPFLPKICGFSKYLLVEDTLKCFFVAASEGGHWEAWGRNSEATFVRACSTWTWREGERGEQKVGRYVGIQFDQSPSTKRTFLFITASALQTFIYEERSVRTLCIYHTFYSILVDQLYFCKALRKGKPSHLKQTHILVFLTCDFSVAGGIELF